MDREKVILSQNEKKKKSKKKNLPSVDPRPAKSYSAASGRFSHSGSLNMLYVYMYVSANETMCTFVNMLTERCSLLNQVCNIDS